MDKCYQKKLGLIKRRMTPEAPSIAIPMTTLMIIFLPPLGLPVEIMMPPITMRTNETMRMTVTRICVKLPISTGNALSPVTHVSSELLYEVSDSMHFPMNGTLVLSDMPQHTPGSLQALHALPTFLYHSWHVHERLVVVFFEHGSSLSLLLVIVHLSAGSQIGAVCANE